MPFADSITVSELLTRIGTDKAPMMIDARSDEAFSASPFVLPAARRIPPGSNLTALSTYAPNGIVVYCVKGAHLGQALASSLRSRGLDAAWLEGGINAWTAAGGTLIARKPDADMRFGGHSIWVTRRRPKIDRAACPWFIKRFVDPQAEFLFVEPAHVLDTANAVHGIAYDIEGAPVTHDGPRCSFDTLLDRYEVTDKALRQLAVIIRAADTAELKLAPEASGLLAMSLGLSALLPDDHAMIGRAAHLYDALYAYVRFASQEKHGWPPRA